MGKRLESGEVAALILLERKVMKAKRVIRGKNEEERK